MYFDVKKGARVIVLSFVGKCGGAKERQCTPRVKRTASAGPLVTARMSNTSDSQTDPERHRSDLYTRPGWVDATVALSQLDQGKANGDRGILWLRSRLQLQLRSLGSIVDVHAGKVLFVSLLIIATFCVGIKSAAFHTNVEQLWASANTEEVTPIDVLSTHQMLLQTALEPDVGLLHPHGLLEHLSVLRHATQVTVTMFDITWHLKDICQSPGIPNFDAQYIEQMFENMMPCSIITPLDCFWEGSKLLGPDFPVNIPYGIGNNIKWTNLNPSQLVANIKAQESNFDYHSLTDYFKRSGITTGYQEKPCLNPKDPECPVTAPNHNTSRPLDVGAELTSGCYGFATKYMHWPEELIVGGVQKNKTGHIKQAKALQTVIQLMGEHDFYEFWSETYKVHHIGWSQEKASLILGAWQKRFSQEIEHLTEKNATSKAYLFSSFSTSTLNRILAEHSRLDIIKYAIIFLITAAYAWIVHSPLAALGVFILASSTSAGLGVCSLLGLPMNLLSTQVLPFVTVGLALRELFMLLSMQSRNNLTPTELLQRMGMAVFSAAVSSSVTLLVAAIIPVPALRVFCMQCAIIVLFHAISMILVLPSLLALGARCKKAQVPCFQTQPKNEPSANNNNNDTEQATSLMTAEKICRQKKSLLAWLLHQYIESVLLKPFMKVTLSLTYVVLIIFCVFNGLKLEYDVRLSSFLPKNTQEYKYLDAQNRFLGFYNFYLVTTELEYPLNQPLLYEYHSSLTQVPHVLKDSNGGLSMNDFWLENFRDYLMDLQQEFDLNRSKNCVSSEKWFGNATEKAVLAFKLLAQTGIVEFPVDKSQIFKKTLVKNGIIDPKAFYNYLSVWNCNDQMSYSNSQSNLTPKPFQYYSSKNEFDLKIRKSLPLVYTQMPFYLKNLRNTGQIVQTLKQIREISESFRVRGLKNYPIGLIFSFFNQFLYLDSMLALQLGITIFVSFLIACVMIRWTKLWCTFLSLFINLLLMCLMNINAFTGTLGAFHFIIITRNVMLIATGFLSAIGTRENRLRMSLELNMEPILKGDVGLLICATVLVTSHFEFIQFHMFTMLLISVCGSTANALVFYPITLLLVGPKAEVQPLEHTDRISTPPPPPAAPIPPSSSSHTRPSCRSTAAKTTREPSLTTITEESCNQNIIIEPQVTVEYSSPESSSSGQYAAKITATANIKVEVVAPMYRNKCNSCKRTKCSHRKQQCQHCCKDSDSSDSNVETDTNRNS
ncbi:hypothetical protein PPYR_09287 [Photinus pyralis]|uniref:SSD domain-containing protein n=1 Tax=Photinus pyralis TaxID=7054 RepID=A0A1Y1L590_PHOPY|nr:protein patched isoform X1 [Photinus pyralis]KAB0798294.1 hypothetical protein PPYR_09287 [Photinus pyralis]